MEHFKLFDITKLPRLLRLRPNETKFGEHVKFLSGLQNIYDQLLNLDVSYVLYGISESIGVSANLGNTGTEDAWEETVKVLLNMQSNKFTKPEKLVVLGHFQFKEFEDKLKKWKSDPDKKLRKMREMLQPIDAEVAYLNYLIIKAGKIPIAIGGGHNNSYGMLKGTAMAKLNVVNCVNLDAHSDFRSEEGRHSGNGFSYAFAEGFLKRYFIFGLHENYTSANILRSLKILKNIDYISFEDLEITKKRDFFSSLDRALSYVDNTDFGLEIDCDAIKNIESSAKTPTGFEIEDARRFINFFASKPNVAYLHIAEGVPDPKNPNMTGKLISTMITDFMKAYAS